MKISFSKTVSIAMLCISLFLSCTSEIEPPPPPQELPPQENYSSSAEQTEPGKSSSSNLPDGKVWCLFSGGCIDIVPEDCLAIGQIVQSCQTPSSNSVAQSSSGGVSPPTSSSSNAQNRSSSSLATQVSSSSKANAGTNYLFKCECPGDGQCRIDGGCPAIAEPFTLQVGECLEVEVINYDNLYWLPTLIARCQTFPLGYVESVTISLNGTEETYTETFISIDIGKMEMGNNKLGPLCLTAISGATNVECQISVK